MEQRRRNRRGEGELLRAEIIAAAVRLLEQDEGDAFSLRAVAKEAQISPPAVYLQFPDIGALLLAVLERLFSEQVAVLDAAEDGIDPGDARALLHARALAYVRFGLERRGTYRVLYEGRAIPKLADPTLANFTQPAADRNAALIRALRPEVDAARLGLLLWTGLHGLVSARINKPVVPWPPVEELALQVVEAYLKAG